MNDSIYGSKEGFMEGSMNEQEDYQLNLYQK